MWFDAMELGEFDAKVYVSRELVEQGRQLREYRQHFQAKRRQLVRNRLSEQIEELGEILSEFEQKSSCLGDESQMAIQALGRLREVVGQIDMLLGSANRPNKWNVMQQQQRDENNGSTAKEFMRDALRVWPSVKATLYEGLYGAFDPMPVDANDLGEIVDERPVGPISVKLNWSTLSDEEFERLVYQLFSEAEGYENVQWLQKTHAPDRSRDISAERVHADSLGSVRRFRVIVQCKHWLKRSVGPSDIGEARDAMALWQPPRVEVLIIVTSGRFTADAVAMVEHQNQSDRALVMEMWPESHLESLLAVRPHLIGEFGLRS